MDAKKYQELAARTLINKPDFEISDRDIMAVWTALGLSGEAGELANLIKKGVFHRHGIDLLKVEDEIGDVMWYVAGLCTTLRLSLSSIMDMNIAKLEVRYPNGFSSEDSKKRVDVDS